MDIEINMDIPMLDQVKIQASVLVPLVKRLETELGKPEAHRIVREAVAENMRRMAKQFRDILPGDTPVEKVAAGLPIFSAGGALDMDVTEQTKDTFTFAVTRCQYAEFYKTQGESELGYLLVCDGDHAMAEAMSPDLEFTRTQTIMQGAPHCDFCYRAQPADTN